MTEREIRAVAEIAVERRADGEGRRIVGHAAVFDTPTDIGGMFREQIARGAFRGAIERDDVPLLINHEGLPLARNTSGTLTLSEDRRGLRIESELSADDPDVQRLVPKLDRGDVTGMSFAFRATRQTWEDGDPPLRTIEEAELFDVSIVTTPAYPTTDVALRSLKQARKARNFHAVNLRKTMGKGLRWKDLERRLRLRSKALAAEPSSSQRKGA